MPIQQGKDTKGKYYQYGATGKKYYYNENSVIRKVAARNKAIQQARAIKANQ